MHEEPLFEFWGVTDPVLIAVLIVFTYVASSYLLYRMGKKAEYENSWYAWVPIADTVMMAHLGGLSGWSVLLALVPLVNIAYLIALTIRFYGNFGIHYGWVVLGMVVGILSLPLSTFASWGMMAYGAFSQRPYEQRY